MIPFSQAKLGDESYIYSMPDGDLIYGEVSWVTELDHFDERDSPMTLRRQRWQLMFEDTITLDDPYPSDDE